MMKIPLVNLKAQYQSIKKEMDAAIQRVIDNTSFIGGTELEQFENAFAKACSVKYCIGVGNGTDALFISLRALGIGQGDKVITAANSFIASSEAITMAGAQPVFIDCDPVTYTMDVAKLTDYLARESKKIPFTVKAVMPVHLYGRPADLNAIMEFAKKYRLKIVEDCAQAHLARYNGKTVGGIGDVGCFSFYPGKNLGAYGDGGAIVTNDEALAGRARMFANHGRISKYDHELEGVNSRLDALQAAILNVKLQHLQEWNDRRHDHAMLFQKNLSGFKGVRLSPVPAKGTHVYHLFVVNLKNRDAVQKKMKENGIDTGVHYPIALPNLLAYKKLGHKPADFPVASAYQNEILSLPMYPELTETEIKYICDNLKKAVEESND
ncbi:MAG: DegT/DnrJ/EryC1/StrS family aminotransferase [Bacteroidota bacterium]